MLGINSLLLCKHSVAFTFYVPMSSVYWDAYHTHHLCCSTLSYYRLRILLNYKLHICVPYTLTQFILYRMHQSSSFINSLLHCSSSPSMFSLFLLVLILPFFINISLSTFSLLLWISTPCGSSLVS